MYPSSSVVRPENTQVDILYNSPVLPVLQYLQRYVYGLFFFLIFFCLYLECCRLLTMWGVTSNCVYCSEHSTFVLPPQHSVKIPKNKSSGTKMYSCPLFNWLFVTLFRNLNSEVYAFCFFFFFHISYIVAGLVSPAEHLGVLFLLFFCISSTWFCSWLYLEQSLLSEIPQETLLQ